MSKFKVIIYEEFKTTPINDNPYYADTSLSISLEFRPLVGDIYTGDSLVKGYKVDSLIYCGNNVFHAYCSVIKADNSSPSYYVQKNLEETLIAHTLDQMKDFPNRYQKVQD
jgi:hypothetical protein